MVHFLISEDENGKKHAEDVISYLPNSNVSRTQLYDGTSLVYNKRNAYYTELDDAEVWGFGTFFNEDGFHESALEPVTDLNSLLGSDLRGHYIFVINSKSEVRVIPDKIGLLNIYYSTCENPYISTDPALVTICSSETKLSEQSVKEFILNESTIGNQTLFSNTKRLGFGKELILANRHLSTRSVYTYQVESLSDKKYFNRINNYFEQINMYDGNIASDISAGFDTRTVAAVGHTTINDLAGNTNPNPNDRGADETISPKIADRLSLPLTVIENEDEFSGDERLMLHGTTLGRDINRSSQLPKRMKNKYNKFDLILGGYGGETLRAKYNHLSPSKYYNSYKSDQLFQDDYYKFRLLSKLSNYPNIDTTNQLMNLWYTIDRMRIWGGSWVTMSSIYGDTLHPFMDWHLINPVFSLPPSKLENAKYQNKIIEHFAPQLVDLPINATSRYDYYYRNAKKKVEKQISKSNLMTGIANGVLSFMDSTGDEQTMSVHENDFSQIDSSTLSQLNIDLHMIEDCTNANIVSRTHSILAMHNYIQNESQ